MSSGLILSEGEIPIYTSLWDRLGNAIDANVGEDRMNLEIRESYSIKFYCLLGGRMIRQRSRQLPVLTMGNYP